MAKRSQAERRRKQLARAVRTGDLDTVRALLERSPERAAHAILEYATSIGSGLSDESWVALALDTSSRLRRESRFELAAAMANAVAAASPRLRVEHALATFGLGDEGPLRQLAAEDDAIAELLAPCLALVDGRALPKTPAGATPLARGVYGICRAAAAIAAARTGQARMALRSVTPEFAAPLCLETWQNLGESLTSGNRRAALSAAAEVAALEPVKQSPELKAALGWELGRRHRGAFVVAEWKLLSPEQSVAAHAARASMNLPSDPVARLKAFVEQSDTSCMDNTARATAALYQAYFLVGGAPEKAEQAFNHAVALGADMSEALRGRWLAARTMPTETWPPPAGAIETAVKSTERLARLLEREPDGHPFRALLLGELGALQEGTGQLPECAKTLEALKELEQLHQYDDPALRLDIERFELVLLASRDPHAALERLEPRLTETQREHTLWELAIKLQHDLGLKDRFEETVLRAAKLSISPACMRLAKPLFKKRRLADAAPGAMTPGLLANELRIRFAELGYGAQASKFKKILAAQDLGRARAALSGEGQTAYDFAVMALLSRMEQGDLLLSFASDALASAPADGKWGEWLGAGALFFIRSFEELMGFARRVARKRISSRVVEFITLQVAVTADPLSARKFLSQVAGSLDARALKRVLAAIELRQLPADMKGVATTVREAARLLQPEYDPLESERAPLDGFDGDADEFEEEFDDDESGGDDINDIAFDALSNIVTGAGGFGPMLEGMPRETVSTVRVLLGSMGLPRSKISRLSTHELAQVMDVIMRIVQMRPTEQSARDMMMALSRFGFTPEDFSGLSAPGQLGRKSRGSSTCRF